jgi:hypothetical protein
VRENRKRYSGGLTTTKPLRVTIATLVLIFGIIASRADNVDRISAATGVPVATLQAERASTGLGWEGLEKAHLLAKASGQSFDNVVSLHQSGQGWGKIARDNGLNLGELMSNAHRSSNSTDIRTMHDKSGTNVVKDHRPKTRMTRGSRRPSSGFSRSRGVHSMGRTGGSHGVHSRGRGGRHGR